MAVIQFLSTELESSEWENADLLNGFVTLLDAENKIFSVTELDWFAKASYNLALKLPKSARLEQVIRLLDLSTQFADKCHHQSDPQNEFSISQHDLLCEFLKIVRISGETRNETNITEKTETSSIEAQHQEWLSKYRIILALDFEASIFINDWTTVSNIVEESSAIIDENLGSIFLDCVLRSEAPITDVVRTVKELIRTLHGSPSPYLNNAQFCQTLPRYLRCLFQLSLDATDYHLAESVLDQALVLARERRTEPSQSPYPSDEIQWLSTVAFNRAVDFYLTSADADCQRWADKAITLADQDNCDTLGRLLREKLETLA
ncbi:hypothetical protein BO94DRAFT_593803 [Aspergillus sclerotioniger CBS 115572]|uniref:Uncharacterized protein n=1 Tax=Aspergillus sclerotioniger CBS 115572 TaxID=1450535 RepID=A0A317WST6_9EURO|nr:hypothetical protein BO94DRAFT_593803 [Aspergillus sclerotioniger CBS 115572]PWY89399.1 hypothetical protein BO94DRAFT_593803 [Aspergillus sclerotioniger CBS 115572]